MAWIYVSTKVDTYQQQQKTVDAVTPSTRA